MQERVAGKNLVIRGAGAVDAAGIAHVMQTIAKERVHSAIDQAWTIEEERRYLESLSQREVFHVAIDSSSGVVGVQGLELWSPLLGTMAHVGQVGTFVLPEWRGRGVGRRLWACTEPFARANGYAKLVVQVRASNEAAQAFYRQLGFEPCGRLRRQVKIDGVLDDEVLMELALREDRDEPA